MNLISGSLQEVSSIVKTCLTLPDNVLIKYIRSLKTKFRDVSLLNHAMLADFKRRSTLQKKGKTVFFVNEAMARPIRQNF